MLLRHKPPLLRSWKNLFPFPEKMENLLEEKNTPTNNYALCSEQMSIGRILKAVLID